LTHFNSVYNKIIPSAARQAGFFPPLCLESAPAFPDYAKGMKTTIVALLGFLTLAAPELVNAQFEYTTNADETLTITGYTGLDGTVAIPTNINGLLVADIGIGAFWRNAVLTNVTIPESVTAIGGDAFANCVNLASVAIQDSVTNIGDGAFQGCVSLTNVTIPNGVTEIGMSEFNGCLSLKSVAIPGSVTSINFEAFGNCIGLETVTIPGGVTAVGSAAFDSCSNLSSLYFEGDAPHVDSTLLNADTNTTVYFPPCAVGWSNTFAGRPALAATPPMQFSFTTNGGTITIDGYSGSCGTVVIPPTIYGMTVTGIGDSAFSYSGSLTGIAIPASVTNIGDQALAACTKLARITVDAQNPFYSSGNGVLFDKAQTTLIQYPCGMPGSYSIPGGITHIGDFAFYACAVLTNVTIPSTVASIENDAFGACGSLTKVTIPGSVISIGDFAFLGCISLTNVIIDNGVANIGNGAFAQCASLTGVTISDTVTNIGYVAFQYCYSLASITIPGSVANIGYAAFASCINLSSVYFTGNAPTADPFAFGIDPMTVYYLPDTTGWGYFDGFPTVLWNPTIQVADGNFGIKNNHFGFNISGTADISFVVEACMNLVNPIWQPLQTNTLTDGAFYFGDSQWTNYTGRFYRIRWP
jgi:hypothetical protein